MADAGIANPFELPNPQTVDQISDNLAADDGSTKPSTGYLHGSDPAAQGTSSAANSASDGNSLAALQAQQQQQQFAAALSGQPGQTSAGMQNQAMLMQQYAAAQAAQAQAAASGAAGGGTAQPYLLPNGQVVLATPAQVQQLTMQMQMQQALAYQQQLQLMAQKQQQQAALQQQIQQQPQEDKKTAKSKKRSAAEALGGGEYDLVGGQQQQHHDGLGGGGHDDNEGGGGDDGEDDLGSMTAEQKETKRKEGLQKGPWSLSEDAQLIRLVSEIGARNWSAIAMHMKGREAKQCRDRWQHHLCPGIKKGPWTQEEDELILTLRLEMGQKVSCVCAPACSL